MLYGMMYAVNAGALGAAFAVWGLGLSAVVRNRYLALLIPVCYCVFTGVAAQGNMTVTGQRIVSGVDRRLSKNLLR